MMAISGFFLLGAALLGIALLLLGVVDPWLGAVLVACLAAAGTALVASHIRRHSKPATNSKAQ